MELTKKQRREIYLKAAERVFKHRRNSDGRHLCYWLAYMGNTAWIDAAEDFPEFALFKPEWWEWNDFESRIICMLLCAEMCND